MHPLVRDLYKRVLIVGKDYPAGLPYVKQQWKVALQNPKNCPSAYDPTTGQPLSRIDYGDNHNQKQMEKEIRKAVGKGRFMIREMIGIIQLKKYRTINQRYNSNSDQEQLLRLEDPIRLEKKEMGREGGGRLGEANR